MEYIDIISKEAVTTMAVWPILTVSFIVISAIICINIYNVVTKGKKSKLVAKLVLICGLSGLCSQLIAVIISNVFLQVPTGQYQYKATVDTEHITVAEYEKFIEEYDPEITDGIYSWIGD